MSGAVPTAPFPAGSATSPDGFNPLSRGTNRNDP